MQKLILLILLANTAQAIIPTIDQHILASDITTMTTYASTMGSYISRVGQATTVAKQVEQLHSLQQLQSVGSQICALCSQTDTQNLQNYINNINDDLCSQFSWSMQNITGVAQNVTNINEIIAQFQVNPQAAALALQRSVVQTAASTQNTLAQMQMLMAQQGQKQLAEQKLEKQNNNDVYTGFSQSGL
jgi:hypothetical protein